MLLQHFLKKKNDGLKSPIPKLNWQKAFYWLFWSFAHSVNLVVCCSRYVFYVRWSFRSWDSLIGLQFGCLCVCVLWRWLLVWLAWRVCALVRVMYSDSHKTSQCDMNRDTTFRHESKLTWTNCQMILPHPYFTEGVCSGLCPRVVPRSRCTNSALVSSLQIVVSHVVSCKKIVQGVLLFVNFWPSSVARLHWRWRVSSKQLHVIRHHSRYNVIREKSRTPSRLRCHIFKRHSQTLKFRVK